MEDRIRRSYLRAPFCEEILFSAEGHVHVARAENISEGGLLIKEMPFIPPANLIPMILPLPDLPLFYKLSSSQLLSLRPESLRYECVRFKAKLVRSFKQEEELGIILHQCVGAQWISLDESQRHLIRVYAGRVSQNILFLLNILEGRGSVKKEEKAHAVRHLYRFLGRDIQGPMNTLRKKLLHDYQGLESL